MPIKFWNDKKNLKYKNAYFNKFKGVWHHGDYAEIKKNSGGYIIYGRSDATLNPGGVRLGTAEIYSVVEKFLARFCRSFYVKLLLILFFMKHNF